VIRRRLTLTLLAATVALALALAGAVPPATARPESSPPPLTAAPALPLSGTVIAIDPGHQLGNSNPRFASKLAKTKWNGTITKGCNTTGTATNGGFPEATFT
jgi:N-acetylmuramoyl-L-alanine amidase